MLIIYHALTIANFCRPVLRPQKFWMKNLHLMLCSCSLRRISLICAIHTIMSVLNVVICNIMLSHVHMYSLKLIWHRNAVVWEGAWVCVLIFIEQFYLSSQSMRDTKPFNDHFICNKSLYIILFSIVMKAHFYDDYLMTSKLQWLTEYVCYWKWNGWMINFKIACDAWICLIY